MSPTIMPAIVALFVSLCWLTLVMLEHGYWMGLAANTEGIGLTLSSVSPVTFALRRKRGRPRKFDGPSRAVTLTLPESVIAALAKVNGDLSRAVVSLSKRARHVNGQPAAALAVFGNRAVITVRPTRSLEKRTGVHLVPLPDGRALISFHQLNSIADLELMLYDALEDKSLSAEDRRVFEGVSRILRDARRSADVSLVHRTIIVLESSDRRAKAAQRGPNGSRALPR